MANELSGRRVAVLATDGVEQVELIEPMKALKEAGAEVDVVAPKEGHIQGFNHHRERRPDTGGRAGTASESPDANAYDALVLPGGVINPDRLRLNQRQSSSYARLPRPVSPSLPSVMGPGR